MKILVTTSRMPFALDEIRKLGDTGHEVIACDTFFAAPGNASNRASKAVTVASPRLETEKYIDDLVRLVEKEGIELIVPTCEEGFYIAKNIDRLAPLCDVFLPKFETMARLHNKAEFARLCQGLGEGLVPPTTIVTDREQLLDAVKEHEWWLARAAFGRAGLGMVTNHPGMQGPLRLADVEPTEECPWLVQPFIRGEEVCTYSIAHHGKVVAHAVYRHPRTAEAGGGVTFESIDGAAALKYVRRLVEATGYHGQISLDLMRTPEGELYFIECNPRPTAGVTLMSSEAFEKALLRPDMDSIHMVEPGRRTMIASALVRNMLLDWSTAPTHLRDILEGGRDIYVHDDDLLPGLYMLLSYGQILKYRWEQRERSKKRHDYIAAQFQDILWDGA